LKAEQGTGGILDLTAEDFSNNLFALDGEWEFYHGRLYAPLDFANGLPEVPEGGAVIQVPLSWEEAGYSLHGCATYRLTLKTDEPELMMLIPQISESSIVWINGQKVFEAGKPGLTKEESVVSFRNAFVTFRPENGGAEIIVQASNHGWYASGLHYTVETARPDILFRDAMPRRIMLGLFLGALLTMGIYHTMLFLHNSRDWAYLAFALFCFVCAVRFSVETNGFASLFLPGGMSVGLIRLQTLVLLLHGMAIVFFTHAVFGIPLKSKARRAAYILLLGVIPLPIVFLLPYGAADFRLVGYSSVTSIFMAFVSAARSKRLKENPYNILFLLALALLISWGTFNKGLLKDAVFMSPVAHLLFIVVTQCLTLSVSYAESKRREEELAAKTDFYRRMSHDLRTPLTKISTNIQIANRQEETDHERLTKSQDEIMRMAGIIDAALDDGGEGVER
jgi:hypothetical protein